MNRISSRDELVSFVRAHRQNLAACYERLAAEMATFGESKLETIYRSLADDAERQSVSVEPTHSGAPDNGAAYVPVPVNAELPGVAGLSTPYTIWAFAVGNEVKVFEELVAANIPINNSHLQSALGVEARACLDRAAEYRAQRRLAFHAERLSNEIAMFPDIRRIDTREDFAQVALAIEHYFQSLLSSYDGSSGGLVFVIMATDSAISFLEPIAQDAHISKRLDRPLKRLAKVTAAQEGRSGEATCGVAKIAIEADRIFDYYDDVFETALDPQVGEVSQHLSASVLERLRSLRALMAAAATTG